VHYLKQGPILAFLQAAVVERQPLVFDSHDHLPWPAQDVDVVRSLLSLTERVLDDVPAHQIDGLIQLIGRRLTQTEPIRHLPHEVDDRRKEVSVGGDREAGDRFVGRCVALGHEKSLLEITLSIRILIFSGLAVIRHRGGEVFVKLPRPRGGRIEAGVERGFQGRRKKVKEN
jgi:hypothetical protein